MRNRRSFLLRIISNNFERFGKETRLDFIKFKLLLKLIVVEEDYWTIFRRRDGYQNESGRRAIFPKNGTIIVKLAAIAFVFKQLRARCSSFRADWQTRCNLCNFARNAVQIFLSRNGSIVYP